MKKFNPQDWLTPEHSTNDCSSDPVSPPRENPAEGVERGKRNNTYLDSEAQRGKYLLSGFQVPDRVGKQTDIELILSRIESSQTDITANYTDWRDIGFALADEFGESGREYYHRISRYYPKYTTTDCNKQYNNCLKAKGHGITMKTFFHLAKQSGIDITHFNPSYLVSPLGEMSKDQRGEIPNSVSSSVPMPVFPDPLFSELPGFLQRIVRIADSSEEKDILLLGSLVAISACLPNIYGIYDGKKVFPNLYLFITAQASAGKGRLVHCKQLVKIIHKELREQARLLKSQYESDLREYNAQKGIDPDVEKPSRPPEKMLFIPANSSTTGVFQLLYDNEGKGLIFETEGDTLAQSFKTDYGNYSDGFRKAFHHETISYYRRTDREYVDIETPCLSTVLSGTPKQVTSLIPNAENGLFSRFIFYSMNLKPVWKNVFATNNNKNLEEYFDKLGHEFLELYRVLNNTPSIQFCLTQEQQNQFNTFFAGIQEKYMSLQTIDYVATIRRLGLIAFRLAMVISVLEILETGDLSGKLICSDRNFQSTLSMIKVLVKHSSRIFSELPEEKILSKPKNRKEQFLDKLPGQFSRQIYLETARGLSIPDKTAEGYITAFCDKGLVFRQQQNHYINLTLHDGEATNQKTKDFKETKETED